MHGAPACKGHQNEQQHTRLGCIEEVAATEGISHVLSRGRGASGEGEGCGGENPRHDAADAAVQVTAVKVTARHMHLFSHVALGIAFLRGRLQLEESECPVLLSVHMGVLCAPGEYASSLAALRRPALAAIEPYHDNNTGTGPIAVGPAGVLMHALLMQDDWHTPVTCSHHSRQCSHHCQHLQGCCTGAGAGARDTHAC